MSKQMISSKEVLEKFRISYSTLTHYTNIGLLKVIGRKGNKRMYDEEQVKERIPKVLNMVNKGYPLRLIAEQLNNTR